MGSTRIRPWNRPQLAGYAGPQQPPPAVLRLPGRRRFQTGGRKHPDVSEDDRFFLLLCGMHQLFTAPEHAAGSVAKASALRAPTRSETDSPTPPGGHPNLRLRT
ncbi:hypothetical protein [Streptomyces sp. NBC_00038]|uniref:hypothetical protein n=1 Tax=Streptomyces sp. NBC_00038 TaxID=2903615 RepID=UPI0022564FC6|nr:hypothetical protein [Streptomyces sp. NBC_00038]MCX5559552.1 hypothetical protein [Streptomyces sp. NBC_00038]